MSIAVSDGHLVDVVDKQFADRGGVHPGDDPAAPTRCGPPDGFDVRGCDRSDLDDAGALDRQHQDGVASHGRRDHRTEPADPPGRDRWVIEHPRNPAVPARLDQHRQESQRPALGAPFPDDRGRDGAKRLISPVRHEGPVLPARRGVGEILAELLGMSPRGIQIIGR